MEFKGSKEKWEVLEHNWYDTSIVSGDKTIATISIYDEATEENQEKLEEEVMYNFMLIVKAPEMLEIIQAHIFALDNGQLAFYEKYGFNVSELSDRVRQLIKSATEI